MFLGLSELYLSSFIYSGTKLMPFLLDINGGQKILLRLRPASAPDTFYDEDHVVGTMLHEVCQSCANIRTLLSLLHP